MWVILFVVAVVIVVALEMGQRTKDESKAAAAKRAIREAQDKWYDTYSQINRTDFEALGISVDYLRSLVGPDNLLKLTNQWYPARTGTPLDQSIARWRRNWARGD
jgi:hypothetical protein